MSEQNYQQATNLPPPTVLEVRRQLKGVIETSQVRDDVEYLYLKGWRRDGIDR